MKSRVKLWIFAGLALVLGAGATLLIVSFGDEPEGESVSHEGHDHAPGEHALEKQTEGESDTYYTCPMHPSVVSETPGSCPVCGMDLVEKAKSATGMDPQELAEIGRVALSPTQRVLANVATVEASAGAGGAAGEVRAVGVVSYDEQGLASIPSWTDGRIEELIVKETGAVVDEGDPVMEIYSEELLAAQEEYLVSLGSSDGFLRKQTRKRLELLGMSDKQIEQVRKSREASRTVTAFAPNAGTITNLNVRQGQYVEEGTALYDIADLSNVWIEAEIYEKNLAAIDEGMPVRVVADAFPGDPMQGKVTFIHPVVDDATRTVKVRVEVATGSESGQANGGEEATNAAEPAQAKKLKPGMYTSVYFQTGATQDQEQTQNKEQGTEPMVTVPKSAVLRGGKSSSVFVEVEPNVFERRQVELGPSTDEMLAIRSGVEAGEKVAYRGGFLLDSEVQLNSFGGGPGAHHGGHGEDEGVHHGGHGDTGENPKGAEKLSHADIPAGGKEFDPSIPAGAVPEGAWYCDMNDETHWIQHEEGDGECPVCGMNLKQK
jgi:Cu(I)/Ag(I) efflux system membrane fusion protein